MMLMVMPMMMTSVVRSILRVDDGDDDDVDGSKDPAVLNPTISIVVFEMTDLIGIVMGESCTFGIC